MPDRMGARLKTWDVPGQRWLEGSWFAGATREMINEVMRRDAQERGMILLVGGLIAQKVCYKIKATLPKREQLHVPAFMLSPSPTSKGTTAAVLRDARRAPFADVPLSSFARECRGCPRSTVLGSQPPDFARAGLDGQQ